jgi:hypothetical protein
MLMYTSPSPQGTSAKTPLSTVPLPTMSDTTPSGDVVRAWVSE